jgi:hypothetical protein
MCDDKVILYDSPEAAQYRTNISGWVNSRNQFFGENEHAARYSGATHTKCAKCGSIMPIRGLIICNDCYHAKRVEEYNAFPAVEWDGKTPLCSLTTGDFIMNEGQLEEALEDYVVFGDLMIVICEPNYYPKIDDDYFESPITDEEFDIQFIPQELGEKIDELNALIDTLPPASWSPGKTRPIL